MWRRGGVEVTHSAWGQCQHCRRGSHSSGCAMHLCITCCTENSCLQGNNTLCTQGVSYELAGRKLEKPWLGQNEPRCRCTGSSWWQ